MVCVACGAELPTGSRFCNKCGPPAIQAASPIAPVERLSVTDPRQYTPGHLAERILTSRVALEGERKQVTVMFADLKGSMELLADRDPEEARDGGTVVSRSIASGIERAKGPRKNKF